MDNVACQSGQHLAAALFDAEGGQLRGTCHMQPPRLAGNPDAGFVEMLDRRCADDQVLHMVGQLFLAFRRPVHHRRQCCRADRDAEQVVDQL